MKPCEAKISLAQRHKEYRKVDSLLAKAYKSPRHYNKKDPFNELVYILLSTQTNEANYLRTYKALKREFPSRNDLLKARKREIRAVIEQGGLAITKSTQLREIIKIIWRRYGKLSLSMLRKMREAEIEKKLTSLPGIGKKSARCIMMYSLHIPVFPVDTNVYRILRRLGWWNKSGPIRKHEDEIQEMIPPGIRYSLHVNMVAHGRMVCRNEPACGICVIREYCRFCMNE